ncbi:copper-binding protein [uncultured Bradyrhizobium sp.]|uniref:copper-binding protein n=1 Tax=uncultured Bradyrhizobium sp. TaxID=199684 RepID=UPI002616A191|nr:copper-binding protein [uncultured Bradyrhizobium sp.]
MTAACRKKAETPVTAETYQATPAAEATSSDMGNMAMTPLNAAPIMAKGRGTVTAIDKAAGTITLEHGAIPKAKWPATTMAFKAVPAIIDAAKVGEKVDFDLKLAGNAGEVTAIRSQQL